MRTIRIVIEYDGSAFHGWQLQPDDPQHPRVLTVQGELESALLRFTQENVRVRAASRTDAGVHARGQVVAFETSRDSIPLRGFQRGLPTYLHEAIAVRAVSLAEDGWNPRRTSRGKHYRYTYWNDPCRPALDRHRTWFIRAPFDIERMRQGGAHLIGTHDFSSFRGAGCSANHAVRTLYRIEVSRGSHSLVHLDVVGNAFVQYMVRNIAGTLKDVATGRLSPDDVATLLHARDRTRAPMTAPSEGLFLEEVIYDDRLPARERA